MQIGFGIVLLFISFFFFFFFATSVQADEKESGYEAQIAQLDREAKQEMNMNRATQVAQQAQQVRRQLAGFYHSIKKYARVIDVYETIVSRNKQLESVGAGDKSQSAADCKYLADMYSFQNDNERAERMYKTAIGEASGAESVNFRKSYGVFLRKVGRDSEADQIDRDIRELKITGAQTLQTTKQSSADKTSATTYPELMRVELIRKKGQSLFKSGNLKGAATEFQEALAVVDSEIEPEVKRKMLAHMPAYNLDRWHECFLFQADLYKDLADVYYKQNRLEDVQAAYEKRAELKTTGGIDIKGRESDYAYLVTLCDANNDYAKGTLYNILLLKARRSYQNESAPSVMSTLESFAKYMRKIHDTDKAEQLENRAIAIKTGTKPLPKLWFSY
jgi:tetratricopeptide (TPR) repeat protein